MPNIESYKKHLRPAQKNILNHIQKAGKEVSPADLESAGFDKNFAASEMINFETAEILESRYDEEKKERFYKIKQ